ncbi:MAG: M56 family metallopeptidase, partial [Planctomycetaceae bacterium]
MLASEALWPWLVQSTFVASILAVIGCVAVLLCRQPVQRLRLIELTLAGCLLAPLPGLLPGWPAWALLTSAPAEAVEAIAPESASADATGKAVAPLDAPATSWPVADAALADDPHLAEAAPFDPTADAAASTLSIASDAGEPPTEPSGERAGQAGFQARLRAQAMVAAVASYLAILGLLAIRAAIGFARLWRVHRTSTPAPGWIATLFEEIAGPAGRRVRLLTSERIGAPITYWWGRPAIALPSRMTGARGASAPRWVPQEHGDHGVGKPPTGSRRPLARSLRYSLAHEWSHVERGDLWTWYLAAAAQWVFFHQPLVWWLRRQMRLCQDHLADARAAGEGADDDATDYAEFLVRLARERLLPPTAPALGVIDRRSHLHRRIAMLLDRRQSIEPHCRRRWTLFAVMAALALTAGGSMLRLHAAVPPAATSIIATPHAGSGLTQGIPGSNEAAAHDVGPMWSAPDRELRDEDQLDPANVARESAEREDESRAEPKAEEVLGRRVSLEAKAVPLRDALAALARAAKLELRLDLQALQQVELDLDAPVTVKINDEPLTYALGTLIDWEKHRGAFREVRGDTLIITTMPARHEFVARHLPDWLKPHYNHGLLAKLDDDRNVISVTAGAVVDDELLARLATLPKLKELDIGTTTRLSLAGLAPLQKMSSLRKLSCFSLRHEETWLGDAIIERISTLRSLRELSLHECGTTDVGVRRLANLPQLTHLSLSGEGRLTDAACEAIGRLKGLQSLSLSSYGATKELGRMRFTADGIRSLAGLQHLEELHLVGHAVPADSLDFPRLKALSLGHDDVDDAVAERIASLRGLTSLHLVYTRISDDGLKKVSQLPNLSRLSLDSRVIKDAGIGRLKELGGLRHFSLRGSLVTDASLRHLSEIKSLERIDLDGSGEPGFGPGDCFSIQGIVELRALPNLRTLWLTNVAAGGGFRSLQELKQLHELTLTMTDIRQDEFDFLKGALPHTAIHASGGGTALVRTEEEPKPKPPNQGENAPEAFPKTRHRALLLDWVKFPTEAGASSSPP